MSHFTCWRIARIGALLVIGGVLGVPAAQSDINGFNGGTNWTLNNAGMGDPAFFSDDTLQITSNTNDESHSAWFNDAQRVSSFTAQFTYQMFGGDPPSPADGVTFTVQTDSRGTSNLGGGGGCLGYCGVQPSVAVAFNVWQDHVRGVQLFQGGGIGDYIDSSPVNLLSGDPIQVNVTYDGTTLTVALLDLTTSDSFSTTFTVDILDQLEASTTALVGFTGATGGAHAGQTITGFQYTEGP